MRKKRKFYRLNYYIQAPEVRVLDQNGKQLGVFSKQEALQKARALDIDLVETVPHAKPPVCWLIDFKKFQYLENKKQRLQKKKEKEIEIKEFHLRPFIGKHDYLIRLEKIKKFLDEGSRIKIRIKFFGREIVKKSFGFDIINRLADDLQDRGEIQDKPRLLGKTLVAYILPKKRKKYEKTKSEDQKNSSKKV